MPQNTKINCPKCGHEFNVEDALAHQIEEKYREELNSKITTIENDYKAKEVSLAKKEEALKQKQTDIDRQVEERVKTESAKKEKEIKKQIGEDYEAQIKALSEETIEAKKQVQELRTTKIENEQLKRKLDDQKQNLEVEYEQKMTERLKEETNSIRKRESERVDHFITFFQF